MKNIRLKNWDYSGPAFYFITICTQNMIKWFGKIQNQENHLSEAGIIADCNIKKISEYHNNTGIHEYIVMPNHIHMIIEIIPPAADFNHILKDSADQIESDYYSRISPAAGSISVIIRSYKSRTTKMIKELQNHSYFKWHTGYYDRIIRNEKELSATTRYIRYNHLKK